MRRPLSLLLILLLGTVGLTSCGDDDDSSSTGSGSGSEESADGEGGGGTLTKEEFIERGDAICAELGDATGEVPEPESEAEFGDYIREIVAIAEDIRDDFSALEPPEDGESVHQALLAALDDTIEQANGAAEAADSGDTVGAGDLIAAAGEAANAADAEAQEYGFVECGKPDDSNGDAG